MKNKMKLMKQIAVYVLISLGGLITTGILWMLNEWRNTNIDEIIYHLRAPKEGTDSAIIIRGISSCLIPVLIITAIAVFVTLF